MLLVARTVAAHCLDDPFTQLDGCQLAPRIVVLGVAQLPPVVLLHAAAFPVQSLTARELAHGPVDGTVRRHVVEVQVVVERLVGQLVVEEAGGHQQSHVAGAGQAVLLMGIADRPGLERVGDDGYQTPGHIPAHQHEAAQAAFHRGLAVLHPGVQHRTQVIAMRSVGHAHGPDLLVADVLPPGTLPLQVEAMAVGHRALQAVSRTRVLGTRPASGDGRQGRYRMIRLLIVGRGLDDQQEITVD